MSRYSDVKNQGSHFDMGKTSTTREMTMSSVAWIGVEGSFFLTCMCMRHVLVCVFMCVCAQLHIFPCMVVLVIPVFRRRMQKDLGFKAT